VRLLLGPDEETLTRGFLCEDDGGVPLAARGFADGRLRFNLVVELIDLGGVPGCRGEELLAWCETPHLRADHAGRRALLLRPSTSRPIRGTCRPWSGTSTPSSRPGRRSSATRRPAPVVVRAVATTEPCEALTAGGPFASDALVGCAYSCPVQLDLVDEVQLSLDTLSARCEREVVACANGPF
jgi:hypothetical protein